MSKVCLKGVSRGFQGRFRDVSMVLHGYLPLFLEVYLKEVTRGFNGVLRNFQENVKGVSKKFHVAWHSSQLPEQKEGLFFNIL